MKDNIYASLPNHESAVKAVGALLDHGVKPENISILMKTMPSIDNEAQSVRNQAQQGITVTTTEDAVEGAKKGATVGLGLSVIAAIASVAIPGVGLVLGGGALATALIGVAATTAAGAVSGSVAGYLMDQGIESHHAEEFTRTVEAGGALIGVSYLGGTVISQEIIGLLQKYDGTVQPFLPSDPLYPGVPPITHVA